MERFRWACSPTCMLNPDLHHTQATNNGFTTGAESAAGLANSPDTVRYLSDLWENLCALQEMLAKDPLE